MSYKICGFALQGIAHIKNNIPCQDKIAFIQNETTSVVALSDGAGTARYSHFGAKCSVELVCFKLLKDFDRYFNQKDGLLVKTEIVKLIKEKISILASNQKCSISDMAHTLLFVAIKKNKFILFHIGDGVIGYAKNDNIHLASMPNNGEFANETFFTTSQDAHNYTKIIKGDMDKIGGFVLMSDGTSESLYSKQSKTLVKLVYKILLLNSIISNDILKIKLEESFKKHILTRTTDDCSLLIISKNKKLSKPKYKRAVYTF